MPKVVHKLIKQLGQDHTVCSKLLASIQCLPLKGIIKTVQIANPRLKQFTTMSQNITIRLVDLYSFYNVVMRLRTVNMLHLIFNSLITLTIWQFNTLCIVLIFTGLATILPTILCVFIYDLFRVLLNLSVDL